MAGPLMGLADTCSWALSAALVVYLRYEYRAPQWLLLVVVVHTAVMALTAFLIGFFVSLTYRRGYQIATYEEALALLGQFTLSGVVGALVVYFLPFLDGRYPRMAFFMIPALSVSCAFLIRFVIRARTAHLRKLRKGAAVVSSKKKVLVVGAGHVGGQLIRIWKDDPESPYEPVGFIDDDPGKRRLKLSGVQVLGTTESIVSIAKEYDVDTVIVGVVRFPVDKMNELESRCSAADIAVKSVIPARQLDGRKMKILDAKQIDVSQALGRPEITTDIAGISRYITGKRVLVTGAGGSIGSELSRQLHKFGPKDLILLDRDESALHGVQLDIYRHGMLDTRDFVLCDIRDREALEAVFEEHRPEVVFHTAALKHLPMLEQYPVEGWKTNVLGTRNVLDLASEYGVGVLVNISTDKAANPTSVLGRTKRLAERMTTWYGDRSKDARFVSVRFGNVLGSRGSMLWTFRRQIEAGGPVTVTHPEVERFFMTIPEACQLVLQAGAIGGPGETMVLDMGKPVKILDLAKRIIAQTGENIEIVFTGLRPGEKISEDLISIGEEDRRPHHPLISHVHIDSADPKSIEDELGWAVTTADSNGFDAHASSVGCQATAAPTKKEEER